MQLYTVLSVMRVMLQNWFVFTYLSFILSQIYLGVYIYIALKIMNFSEWRIENGLKEVGVLYHMYFYVIYVGLGTSRAPAAAIFLNFIL